MNTREKNLVIVAVLFSVAAGGGYWQFIRVAGPGATEATKAGKDDKPLPPPVRIRLNMMDGDDGGDKGVNLFGYRQPALVEAPPPPPPPPPPAPPLPTTQVATTNRGGNTAARGATAAATPAEPPVTEVGLNYSGFARDDDGKLIAFIETTGTGAPLGHYNLREDDFLLGRFRVAKITENTVEVEDMDRIETSSRRKQTLNVPAAIKK